MEHLSEKKQKAPAQNSLWTAVRAFSWDTMVQDCNLNHLELKSWIKERVLHAPVSHGLQCSSWFQFIALTPSSLFPSSTYPDTLGNSSFFPICLTEALGWKPIWGHIPIWVKAGFTLSCSSCWLPDGWRFLTSRSVHTFWNMNYRVCVPVTGDSFSFRLREMEHFFTERSE